MKRYLTSLLLSALALFACSCGPGSNSADRKAIRDCFDQYKTAVVNADGEAAVKLFTTETMQHYAKILALALNGSESEVKALGTFDKIAVLNARHNIEPEKLRQMTGESLLIYGVNQRWAGKEGVQDLSIGTVRLYGDRAVGEALDNGKPTPLTYDFVKQQGQWKFDVVSNLQRVAGELKSMAQEQSMTEDEFILRTLESTSSRKVDESIWIPINKRTEPIATPHP